MILYFHSTLYLCLQKLFRCYSRVNQFSAHYLALNILAFSIFQEGNKPVIYIILLYSWNCDSLVLTPKWQLNWIKNNTWIKIPFSQNSVAFSIRADYYSKQSWNCRGSTYRAHCRDQGSLPEDDLETQALSTVTGVFCGTLYIWLTKEQKEEEREESSRSHSRF